MADRPPNILFLMDDQHRHDWLGCAGADFLRTPNIDALAARGVRFTQCCVNAPVCVPSRVALATGLQPGRVGCTNNESYLPRHATTYYQRLRDAGYHVGCAGKLDLAKPEKYNGRTGDRPCTFGWGFTRPVEIEGKMHAGNSDAPNGPYGFYLQEKGLYAGFREDYRRRGKEGWAWSAHDSVLSAEDHAEEYVGRRAVEWIEKADDEYPWHLFVSFPGPHDPFDPPAEYAKRYRDAKVPAPVPKDDTGKPAWIVEKRTKYPHTPEDVVRVRRQYAAAIEHIDTWIGRILDAVKRRGMLENTLVIYSSDHGEMLGDLGLYTKSVPYEPALRVPLIAAGPGVRGKNRVCGAPVELIDANATVCEWAGLPPQADIDAKSFGAVLRGESESHREDCISEIDKFRLIRTARYKYVEHRNDLAELYDLQEDPGERVNLAPDRKDLAKDLAGRMKDRFTEGKWNR
ncbi:MAG: sulfatase-like hydrolase/transferase [Planctomycetes bacterium]|nr:sulfatase-like hydrolase/transferase [Planctomycetota bacterium]